MTALFIYSYEGPVHMFLFLLKTVAIKVLIEIINFWLSKPDALSSSLPRDTKTPYFRHRKSFFRSFPFFNRVEHFDKKVEHYLKKV